MKWIAFGYAASLAAFLMLVNVGAFEPLLVALPEIAHADKVAHFVLFGLLGTVTNLALVRSGRWPAGRAIAIGTAWIVAVSTLEEFSNLLVDYRGFSLGDLAANYLGIFFLGVLPLVEWRQMGSAASESTAGPPRGATAADGD